MKIEKIKRRNFKCYGEAGFEAKLNDGLNIIVGNNKSGKSTILEAIYVALTGMLNGRYLRNELSTYLFNLATEQAYVASLGTASLKPPREPLLQPAALLSIEIRKVLAHNAKVLRQARSM